MAARRPDHETTSEEARGALDVALRVASRVALRAMAVWRTGRQGPENDGGRNEKLFGIGFKNH